MLPGLALPGPMPSSNSASAGDITNTNLALHPFVCWGGTWPRWPDQAAAQGWHRGQTGGSGTWAQQGPWGGQGRAGHRWENSREPQS